MRKSKMKVQSEFLTVHGLNTLLPYSLSQFLWYWASRKHRLKEKPVHVCLLDHLDTNEGTVERAG